MFKNKFIQAIIGIITFFLLAAIIPRSKKVASRVNYLPDGWSPTIRAEIKGVVTHTRSEGAYWVELDNSKSLRYPFTYDEFKLPDNWRKKYPADFIQPGDSIIKKKDNDTFYLVRKAQKWMYILPAD